MCGGVSDGVHVHVFVQVHMLQATHNALIPPPLITPHPSSFTMEYLNYFNGLLTANYLNVHLIIAQHCKVYLNNSSQDPIVYWSVWPKTTHTK